MVLELLLPAAGVLAVSAGVGAVVYYLSMRRVELALKEVNESQDMRDKRIRDAIKETLVNDLDKLKAEEIKIKETIDDSLGRMKQIEMERNEFKKEVANHLREQLKEELGSRLRDMMARLAQITDEQNRLEEMTNNTKNDVKGGILQVTNKLSSLKDETRKVEDKFIEIQDMFHKLSSRKQEIQNDVIESVKKEGLKDLYARMGELDTQIKLTKDTIGQVEKDRDLIITRIKNVDAVIPHMIKTSKEEMQTSVKALKESIAQDTNQLKEGIVQLAKANKLQKDDLATLGKDIKRQTKDVLRLQKENKRLATQVQKLKKKPEPKKKGKK